MLGNVLQKLDRQEDAVASYRKALELKSDYAEVHQHLGIALEKLGRLEEAVASFQKSLRLKPNYAIAYQNLGVALSKLGKLKEAVNSYRTALGVKPDFAEAHNNLGDALQRLGEPDDAEIAQALELSVTEVRDTVLSGRRAVSLDRAVFDEDEDTTLLKRLADPDQASPDLNITLESSQSQLEKVLVGLDEREHEIIQLYFGLDGSEPMTLEQIGDRMSLTRERIRQLKERAFSKLRHPSRHEELRALED